MIQVATTTTVDDEEPFAANVPQVATGRGQEQVQYATNRLTAVGRD